MAIETPVTVKVDLAEEVTRLCDELSDMKQDRDSLLIRNHELTRKYAHEVGRLNTIISNYRQEIVRLGQSK